MLRGCSLPSARVLPQTQHSSLEAVVSPCVVHILEQGARCCFSPGSGSRLQHSRHRLVASEVASPASAAPEEVARASTALLASSAEGMAQNGGPVQHSRSRSGLLVAKEVLDDKLSDCGRVCACS